ncbi:MAG: radical SAM protein, partial [Verrucomicrobiae bacterium]|nr:radical SAM protein [Verrucomicrobiae bacterium]
MTVSKPGDSELHLFEAEVGGHVFLVDGSRLFDADAETFNELKAARGRGGLTDVLGRLGLQPDAPFIDDEPLADPPLYALSLAIAQKCNLGCTYCYAQQGDFGGTARNMSRETADAAVDLLLAEAEPGDRRNLA